MFNGDKFDSAIHGPKPPAHEVFEFISGKAVSCKASFGQPKQMFDRA